MDNDRQMTQRSLRRRQIVLGAGAATVVGAASYWNMPGRSSESVFIARAASYDSSVSSVVRRGLAELGLSRRHVYGKSILLKPNLVEPALDAPHVNTHPDFIRAVADAFWSLGAREIIVAEGPGHCRDTYLVLEESGVRGMLSEAKLPFVDLNLDDVDPVPNRLGHTGLAEIYLPRTLRRADLIVSLPKMKTHHWTGATLSMKNFFGVMPGSCYGWPKNVLHREGIHPSILDIVGTVRPHLAIVDGIVAMEGDGPIMGDPVAMGVVVMGTNLPAVDASCCRLMGLNPHRIEYLARAENLLGPIRESAIEQRGEAIASLARPFRLMDHPDLNQFKA